MKKTIQLFKHKGSYLYENLNEGLIKSYNFKNVKSYLENSIHFNCIDKVEDISFNPYRDNDIQCFQNAFAVIYLKTDQLSLMYYKKVVRTCYDLLGWNVGYIVLREQMQSGYKDHLFSRGIKKDEFFEGDIEIRRFLNSNYNKIILCYMVIEEKFPIKEYLYSENTVFYHICEKSRLNKILKIGLVPKSNFNYPRRIYLTDSLDDINYMLDNKPFNNPILLKIKLNRNQKLFVDPRMGDQSAFTYDNISPIEIISYEEI